MSDNRIKFEDIENQSGKTDKNKLDRMTDAQIIENALKDPDTTIATKDEIKQFEKVGRKDEPVSEKFDKFIQAVVADLDLASELLTSEPDLIAATNSIGETVFHYLVVENKMHEVSWLLKNGAAINTQNNFGNTPLAEAASLGYLDMCRFLLEHGADHKVKSENGMTALSEAATNNELEVVHLLLDLVQADEKLEDYFDLIAYEVLLDKDGASAKAITEKGLL